MAQEENTGANPSVGATVATAVADVIKDLGGKPEKIKTRKERVAGSEIVAVLGLSRLYGIDQHGDVSTDFIDFDVEELRLPASRSPAHDQVIVLNLGPAKLHLDPGCGIILGKADSGKSLFADTIGRLNQDEVRVLRFREPEADSLISERAFIAAFYDVLTDTDSRVIIVDSLRTVFYSASGTTGKGGVNMGIFERVTAYDVLARRLGKLVLFALNPMSSDADAIDFYLEAARGSVSHTFHATAPLSFRLSSRTGRDRGWKTMNYDPKKAKSVALNGPLVRQAANVFTIEAGTSSILDLYETKDHLSN